MRASQAMENSAEAGSADRWGPLWGARPRDWAESEWQQMPTYEAVLEHIGGLRTGQSVLDVGCGTGAFLRLAADRGALAHGIDASESLVEVARARVPEADLRVGEMESLPFEDHSFDLVTGFNSFFFAADMNAALREAGRVARPGGAVVIQVWGSPQRCEMEAMKAVVRPFLPTPPADAPRAPELWRPGVLEEFAEAAGLSPESAFDVSWAYEYPDDEALGRAMVAPAGIAALVGPDAEDSVRGEIVEALASCRGADGAYRIQNEFRVLIARAA